MPTDFNLEFGKFGNNRPTQPLNNRPVHVKKLMPAGQPFAPEADPADDEPTPELQAPPQEPPADDNSDVLTGEEAEATAEAEDSDCDPTVWCKFDGKDGEPLLDEAGEPIWRVEDREEAQHACAKNDDCVGIGLIDDAFQPFADFDGAGDIKGELKPTEDAADDEPEAPEAEVLPAAPEGDAGDAGDEPFVCPEMPDLPTGLPPAAALVGPCEEFFARNEGEGVIAYCLTAGQGTVGTAEEADETATNCRGGKAFAARRIEACGCVVER